MISFKDMTLTRIVWLVAGVGLALALFFALGDIQRSMARASSMQRSAALVDLSVKLSGLVHEQQKERGASEVFLTSGARSFRDQLLAQRKVLDAKRKDVAEAIAAVQDMDLSEALIEKLVSIDTRLAKIEAVRTQIDKGSLTADQATKFYTDANAKAIALVGDIAADVSDAAIARELLVYSAFLSGKDLTGLDRSNGASGLSVGAFTPNQRRGLIALPAARKSYFDFASAFARPEQAEALSAILDSPQVKRIETARAAIIADDLSTAPAMSGADWFKTQTAIIDRLKTLEDTIAQDIAAAMLESAAEANQQLWLAGIILLAGLAFAAGLCLVIIRTIRDRIDAVVTPLRALADGRNDVAIPDLGRNEFKVLGRAMQTFKKNVIEREEADAKLKEVVEVMGDRLRGMARGDLTRPIDSFFAKEFASIRMDYNDAQEALREMIYAVIDSATAINHSASEVNQAATDLSGRTMRQAATLEETAAALEKTTKGIKQSAEKAQSTNEEIARTRQLASDNGAVVDSAIAAMERIQSSFAEVEQITHMIQNIAFQTNILALNAGVEATRAGEAGKGFGVVATEVRALAQRSSEAVTSIQELMSKSAENIASGSQQVMASGTALRDMISKIDAVSQSIAELAEASQNQASGLSEVNDAVAELDMSTQQNAAMAEESSAASNQLNAEAQNLVRKTALFDARGDEGTDRPTPAASIEEGTPVDLSMSA